VAERVRELGVATSTFERIVRAAMEHTQARTSAEQAKRELGSTEDARTVDELNDELKGLQARLAAVDEELSERRTHLRELESELRALSRDRQQLQERLLQAQSSAQGITRMREDHQRLQKAFEASQVALAVGCSPTRERGEKREERKRKPLLPSISLGFVFMLLWFACGGLHAACVLRSSMFGLLMCFSQAVSV
jgi:chromosome segregation ATPase